MRYEIKPSYQASPVFLTPPGESSGAFRPLATCPISTDWMAIVSSHLASVYVCHFVTHIYTRIKRRKEMGDVSPRLNLGEDVLF
jgi:hypothetical protein